VTVDLHTLTGAYALHAISDTERVAFKRHLAECVSCTQEVRELRVTAARLGLTTAVTPPPHLRHAVLARIRTESPRRIRRPRVTRLVAAAAAVLFAATVALGATVAMRQHDVTQAQHRTDTLTTVLRAQDARVATGDGITVVVSRTLDRGVLVADLPAPPGGHIYQVWTVDSRYHPAGTLTGGMAELIGITAMDRVAVTVEPSSGSPQPTTAPVAETALP
jgi:anti-sigma factor RsiW